MRRSVRHVLRGKCKVMWTRFDCNRQTFGTSSSEHRKSVRRRVMNNMDAASGLAAEADHQYNCLIFRLAWARAQKRAVMSWIKSCKYSGCFIYRPWNLGVDKQNRAKPGDLGHRQSQIGFCNMWELINTRVDQKAFEPANSSVDQRRKLCRVPRHDAAPKRHVHSAFTFSRSKLLLKSGKSRCRRNAVERHIHYCRNAACRCRLCRRFITFPFGAAGLVDVDVSINISSHYDGITRVLKRNTGGNVIPLANRSDPAIADMHRCRADDQRCYDEAAADNLIYHFCNYTKKSLQIAVCDRIQTSA